MEYKKIPSVTRVPLSERVYKILMESIVSGDLLPGTELREQHVAKQMGVSATPVREAFKRLASDGMIELIPYRGAVVKVLDQQEIREAYACREALEHLVAKEVIERVRQEDIDRLYRMIEGFRQAEGVEEIAASSQEFDEYLYQLTGNRTLCDLLALLKGVISRDRKYSAGSPERQQAIYQWRPWTAEIWRGQSGRSPVISTTDRNILRRNGRAAQKGLDILAIFYRI